MLNVKVNLKRLALIGRDEEILWADGPNIKYLFLKSIFNISLIGIFIMIAFTMIAFFLILLMAIFEMSVKDLWDSFIYPIITLKKIPQNSSFYYFITDLYPYIIAMTISFVIIYLMNTIFYFLYHNNKFIITNKGIYIFRGIETVIHKTFKQIRYISISYNFFDRLLKVGNITFSEDIAEDEVNNNQHILPTYTIYSINDYMFAYQLIKKLQNKAAKN
ncbi:MAG: hypothetical protein J6W96_03760 [Alphaproteobacteria bacterium]|nr:hypothetical protein [Alphaproteobacteria bacterium]